MENNNKVQVKIKKIHPDAITPSYAHEGDSGMDIFSVQEIILNPLSRAIVGTGITVEIPFGYEIQFRSKSGLAANHGIKILNSPGTIDSGYRGELKAILYNSDKENSFKVEKRSKVGQLVLQKVEQAELIEEIGELAVSSRGEGGFGSTGLKSIGSGLKLDSVTVNELRNRY